LCEPGTSGTDWRLHARFDPAQRGFADVRLTADQLTQPAPGHPPAA
jgi:hypothetical protein